jgi:hypothetical protein
MNELLKLAPIQNDGRSAEIIALECRKLLGEKVEDTAYDTLGDIQLAQLTP